MGKPASGGSSGGGTVKGTNGNDVLHVSSLSQLRSTIYDGGNGTDTLDLSGLSTGVSIQLPSSYPSSKSILYPDRAYSGFYTDFSLGDTSSERDTGTIKNVENLIGTSGNDYLTVQQGGYADGGPGNDFVAGRTVIGGLGSDSLNSLADGSTATLVGGTYVNGVATRDGQHDTFEVDGNGVILDFELGIDSLIIPSPAGGLAALNAATWSDVTYNGVASARLVIGNQTITLAGVTAAQANTIEIGLFIGAPAGGTITSGPGDDIIWPDGSVADRLIFPDGSGNDLVTHFNKAQDTLVFDSAVTWSSVSVNGVTALRGTYDSGESSVTLMGFTMADVPTLHVELF